MLERCEVRMLAQVTAMRVRTPHVEITKVSLAMSISQGLVGPKEMAKAESDGQQVNIPALFERVMRGRSSVSYAHYWICVRSVRRSTRKIPLLPLMATSSEVETLWLRPQQMYESELPRKFSKLIFQESVPKTETGG